MKRLGEIPYIPLHVFRMLVYHNGIPLPGRTGFSRQKRKSIRIIFTIMTRARSNYEGWWRVDELHGIGSVERNLFRSGGERTE
jgi:hypothetical protein